MRRLVSGAMQPARYDTTGNGQRTRRTFAAASRAPRSEGSWKHLDVEPSDRSYIRGTLLQHCVKNPCSFYRSRLPQPAATPAAN